ncbi:MAG: STAS domain-containing protein [Methylotenera sp.]|nr:STAS domain-containing protein [Methylotenera sp.]
MAEISQQANQWRVSGDLLMDNASKILHQSADLELVDNLEVDFSAVTDVDTSALSLIMEWQRRAKIANHKVRFTNLPVNLTSLADLYGVTEFINY